MDPAVLTKVLDRCPVDMGARQKLLTDEALLGNTTNVVNWGNFEICDHICFERFRYMYARAPGRDVPASPRMMPRNPMCNPEPTVPALLWHN